MGSRRSLLDALTSSRDTFYSKVTRTDGCWFWGGPLNNAGYGVYRFSHNRERFRLLAHRASYMLHHQGVLVHSVVLMHECDTPRCVNPEHLSPGDRKTNAQDRHHKGRTATGEAHGRSKLSDAQVERLFGWLKEEVPVREIARRLDVSPKLIRKYRDGHLTRTRK